MNLTRKHSNSKKNSLNPHPSTSTKYKYYKLIKDYITKGCFNENLGIMTKYELILQCKSLNIDRYSTLSCRLIIHKIANARCAKIQKETESTSFFYPEIHKIIFSYANFYPDDEELAQNRANEIQRAIRLRKKQTYCDFKYHDTATLLHWFKHMEFNDTILNKMKYLSKTQLWALYIMESEKIILLSQSVDDIFMSKSGILQWFTYLFYKNCSPTRFKHHDKCLPHCDIIRTTFYSEIQTLAEMHPEIWKDNPPQMLQL